MADGVRPGVEATAFFPRSTLARSIGERRPAGKDDMQEIGTSRGNRISTTYGLPEHTTRSVADTDAARSSGRRMIAFLRARVDTAKTE